MSEFLTSDNFPSSRSLNHSLTMRIVLDHTSALFACFKKKLSGNITSVRSTFLVFNWFLWLTSLKAGFATARCLFQSAPSVPTILSPYIFMGSYCRPTHIDHAT